MAKTQFIIGTSGWSYNDWRGLFYPEKLNKKDWLSFYQKSFTVVEINATFYRQFADHVFNKWRLSANEDFKYIIKVPRIITHKKYLKDCELLIKEFCRSINLLEDKLALILLQLPPNFPYDLERLKKAIKCFAQPQQVVVEFRDEKWYTDQTKKMLEEIGCVFCAADSPKTTLCNWLTSSIGYIRLHGRTKWFDYNYTLAELQEIAKFAKAMAKNGAKKIYILFNNDYHANAIRNAQTLADLLKIGKS